MQDDFSFCQTACIEPTGVASVKRLLIADQSEIALRAVRTCPKLGLESVGISTTIPFHLWLIARQEFIDASAHIGWVEQEMLA